MDPNGKGKGVSLRMVHNDTNHRLHCRNAITKVFYSLRLTFRCTCCWYRVYNVAKQEVPCQQHPSLLGHLTVFLLPTDIAENTLSSLLLLSNVTILVDSFCPCRWDIRRIDDSREHALPFRILLDADCRMFSWGIAMPTSTVCRDFGPCLSQYRR